MSKFSGDLTEDLVDRRLRSKFDQLCRIHVRVAQFLHEYLYLEFCKASFTLQLLNDTRLHDTYHVSKLKLATDVTYSQLESKQIHIPTDREHDGDYEVDKILDHDFNKVVKKWFYLVSYKGYSTLFDSRWEPQEHLDGATAIRDAYDDAHGIHVASKEGGGRGKRKRNLQK